MNLRHKILLTCIGLLVATLATIVSLTLKSPAGLSDWDSVIRVTEDMLVRGDSSSFLSHIDSSGMPIGKRLKNQIMLRSWQGVPKPLKLEKLEIIAPKDFKFHEDMSERMAKFFGTPKWSHPPEKIIVYRYSGTDGASSRWYFGVFQDRGKWYFSVCYPE